MPRVGVDDAEELVLELELELELNVLSIGLLLLEEVGVVELVLLVTDLEDGGGKLEEEDTRELEDDRAELELDEDRIELDKEDDKLEEVELDFELGTDDVLLEVVEVWLEPEAETVTVTVTSQSPYAAWL